MTVIITVRITVIQMTVVITVITRKTIRVAVIINSNNKIKQDESQHLEDDPKP